MKSRWKTEYKTPGQPSESSSVNGVGGHVDVDVIDEHVHVAAEYTLCWCG